MMRMVTFLKILPVIVLLCGSCIVSAAGENTEKVQLEQECKAKLHIKDLDVTLCGKTVPVSLDPPGRKSPVLIRVFTGIPYAEPPVKELRWRKPQPKKNWPGVLDATQPCPQCPQKKSCNTKPMREDCLYLNVWTPSDIDKPLPVMVFIHGGGFTQGSGGEALYDGSYLAAAGNVVVVTINYRLGILGFLVHHVHHGDPAKEDENLSGNFGLMDQAFALQWIYQYIESFGGDKNNITIFGESAGAMSIGFHLMMKNKVFNAAIMESNPYGIPYLTEHEAAKLGNDVVDKMNMSVSCMRKMEWTELQPLIDKAAECVPADAIWKWGIKGLFFWKPVIQDKTYDFRMQPIKAVPSKKLIIGSNRDEGVIISDLIKMAVKKFLEKHLLIKYEKIGYLEYILIIDALFGDKGPDILREYPPCLPFFCDNQFQLARVFTDYCFTGGDLFYMENAERHGAGKNLYAYYYTHVSDSYCFPSNFFCCSSLPDCSEYACHMAELPYVFHNFKNKMGKGTAGDKDKELSHRIIRYWSNFARDQQPGNPWNNWKYVKLDVQQEQVSRKEIAGVCNYSFWKPIVAKLNCSD